MNYKIEKIIFSKEIELVIVLLLIVMTHLGQDIIYVIGMCALGYFIYYLGHSRGLKNE